MPEMSAAEVRSAITHVLGSVDYVAPTVAYCVEVRDALRPRLPDHALVEVHWRPGKLLVEVRHQDLVVREVVDLP